LTRRANGGVQLVTLAEFETPQVQNDVRRALASIHHRHPMMRGRIEDRETLWWICDVPFERIDIRIETMGTPFDLEMFYASEAAKPLDVTSASWRAVLLLDAQAHVAWIAIVSNHGGIDGRSVLAVVNDLDVLLNEPDTWLGGTLPLAQPAEAGLAAAGMSGDGSLLPIWPEETMWQVERPAKSEERRPHGFLRIVPQSAIAAVHERLRAEGIHMAAALTAAAVQAADVLPGRSAWTGIVAPTDVRADCHPPIEGNAVGEYIAGINLLLGPENHGASLFEAAHNLQRQLLKNRPPSLMMDANVPLETTRRQVDQMASASNVFSSGICVTDVGDLNRLSGRRVGISRVLLMPSQNHGIHPILVAIVSTNAGLCLSFGYDEPLRTRANAHAFAERYIEAIGEFT